MQDNQEEEEEEIIDGEGEIKDLKNEEKIKINLDKPIEEKEIKEIIKKKYINEMKDYDIFQRNKKLKNKNEEIFKNFNSFGLMNVMEIMLIIYYLRELRTIE